MAKEKVIVVETTEHIEEYSKNRLLITDKAGDQYKIGEKFKAIWPIAEEHPGEAIKLIYSSFTREGKEIEYVSSMELVKDILQQEAIKKVAMSMGDNKNKSFALSYAKDLAVANVIDKMQLLTWAELFDRWLNGDIGIPDEIVTELFGKYVRAQSKKEEK